MAIVHVKIATSNRIPTTRSTGVLSELIGQTTRRIVNGNKTMMIKPVYIGSANSVPNTMEMASLKFMMSPIWNTVFQFQCDTAISRNSRKITATADQLINGCFMLISAAPPVGCSSDVAIARVYPAKHDRLDNSFNFDHGGSAEELPHDYF